MGGHFLLSECKWGKCEIFAFHGPEIECDACGTRIAKVGLGNRSNGLSFQLNKFREKHGDRETVVERDGGREAVAERRICFSSVGKMEAELHSLPEVPGRRRWKALTTAPVIFLAVHLIRGCGLGHPPIGIP